MLIEYALKYADLDIMRDILRIFGREKTYAVWDKSMASDKHFIRTNLLIARVLFGLDVENDYFKNKKNERLEKLKLLVEQNYMGIF